MMIFHKYMALIHNGKYHEWFEIPYLTYELLYKEKTFKKGRNGIILLPTITMIAKIRMK